ncbi:MAG: sensor histidine kinase [Candidatus Methylomirabilales bacterium]
MKNRLLWKLLGINLLLIIVVILVVWLVIDYRAAAYFVVLMKKYGISPTTSHQMFVDAVHRYLIWASILAVALAVVLSLLLTRKVLSPLSQMTEVTRRIADGDYTARVHTPSTDEVGQLATAFNRMADSLKRIEELRKTMVSNVAHELRTPLTNIRGYLEALSDGVMAPSKETFDLLHEEALRLVRLVEGHVQLAKAEGARTALYRRAVDLRELAFQVLDLFRPKFATKEIILETELSDAGGDVLVDPERLVQVLENLLENAWQYTPPGGHVSISAERLAGKTTLIFANTGEGIAPADLPFIFERFYRGEKSRSREYGGAGIGLAIVKELVEAHGGEVGAESSSSETRVWFTLPA